MSKQDRNTSKNNNEVLSMSIKFPMSLVEKIDKYQEDYHINTRTAAIFELIRAGLGELEVKQVAPQDTTLQLPKEFLPELVRLLEKNASTADQVEENKGSDEK